MPNKKKKIALVIGAGSVKCAAALGMWKVLEKEDIHFDMIIGCSGGSLYGAAMAMGFSFMFATVFFGLLDPADGTLLYINAGHEAPFVISNGTLKTRLNPTGPAVGMLPNMDFKIERVRLSPGESLLLYTDGVTDALNAKDEPFTEERLIATAIQPSASAQTSLMDIVSAVDRHIARREQFDDITLLAVHRKA